MKPQKRIGYLLAIAAILVLSCDVSTLAAPQQISTSAPGAIGTIVAQTAAVAASQTAALIPPTLTPSFTPFPTKTASVTPSPTQTFIFKLPTAVKPTRTNTPRPSSGGGGAASAGRWSCNWVGQNPVNSTHFAPGANFNATWTVTNTGDGPWLHTTVDIVFAGGSNLSSVTLYDTTTDTPVGSNYVVSVPMKAPSTGGTYSMIWSLQAGVTVFCSMPLTIIVP